MKPLTYAQFWFIIASLMVVVSLVILFSGCHWAVGHMGKSWKYDNNAMMAVIVEQLKKEINEITTR